MPINKYLDKLTILYVEDDELIQVTTKDTLSLFNINIITANDGQEGLDLFIENKEKIDLILADIQMPKLNGIEMLTEIRKLDTRIPTIITTAHHETDFLLKAIELNVSSYVLKPIDIIQLKDSLIKAIQPKILKDKLIKKNKRLEKEIKKNKKKHQIMITQSRFASMGEMINMIAHQWRQPLASIGTASFNLNYKIQTNAYDLNTKEGRDNQATFYTYKLNEIEQYVQNLTNTIDDFRNFFKTDKKIVTKTISEPINSALRIMQSSFEINNIKLITKLESKKELNIYENEIMHVIVNILKNAQDNFLEIQKENMKINIVSKDLDDCIQVDIIDNGGGIEKEIIDKIFEPYFSTKKEKNGTGIGLYMSKIIIEKHHKGKITVKSFNGNAIFRIKFFY